MQKVLVFLLVSLVSFLNANQIVKNTGSVFVNGKVFAKNQKIKFGDFIETKSKSKVVFNIGKSAFLANANSKFTVKKEGSSQILNVISGGVLAVFKHGDGDHVVKTPNLTAGIRGTGVYAEVRDGKTYFCTCYGETELEDTHNNYAKKLKATHHNMVWVSKNGIKEVHELMGHNDDELRELEALVGRIPDFDKK
ncbi:MAG: FecR domain-containing protein [Campylobacteraceae bacterium]|nr:FecR domain-containing protein [Campylobacteraceae bacterium]